jgi:chromosome segregation ATPase
MPRCKGACKLKQDMAAYATELIETVEELSITKRSLEASTAVSSQLKGELQTLVDTQNLLFRDHVREVSQLQSEVAQLQENVQESIERAAAAEAERDGLRHELQQGAADNEEPDSKQGALERVMLKLRLERVRYNAEPVSCQELNSLLAEQLS